MNATAQSFSQSPDDPLPGSLKRAIAHFPERHPAIDDRHFQRQRYRIHNPLEYLYRAIDEEWKNR